MSEKIEGQIAKIHYYNSDNGYTVALFELDYRKQKNKDVKKKLFGNTINIVGYFDHQVYVQEKLILNGDFVKNKTYGLQFKFLEFERIDLNNELGIIAYLSSDLFKGVGMQTAKSIVELFGTDTIKIIKENPNCLNELKLSNKIKTTIIEGINNDEKNHDATIFFLNNGLTIEVTNRIIKAFGNNVVEKIKNDPYIIMNKIDHFGFKKNDQFAMHIGIEKNSKIRLKALTVYILNELIYATGDTYITKSDLYSKIVSYIGEEIDINRFNEILNLLHLEKKIYLETNDLVFDYKLRKQEIELANEIVLLLKGLRNPNKKIESFSEEKINKIAKNIEMTSQINFNEEQLLAIKSAFTEPIMIITGGPGTGKTTIVNAIVKMYLKLHNDSSALANKIAIIAPTGRAAKRLKETTKMPTSTIHKFLGFNGGYDFEYSKDNKTSARLIIVDEASMMDLSLCYQLVTSMHQDCRLIIVGDVDQLPAVGPGQVLKDLIDTKEIKTIRLTKIHRQAENSSIIKLAHNVNEGIIPQNLLEKHQDLLFIPTDNEHLSKLILDVYQKAIAKGKDIIKNVQILIPMYKGEFGINEINQQIQNIVNPLNERQELKIYGANYRENDKVIQLVNHADKNVMNGDIGYIQNFIYQDFKINGLTVMFDNFTVDYNLEEVEELSLAYATSVHKAQGSEFELVIMPISTKHFIMLKRKLIYTAITRAKQSLVLIGDINALQRGVRNIERNRNSILKDMIINLLHFDQSFSIIESKLDEETFGEREADLKIEDFEN